MMVPYKTKNKKVKRILNCLVDWDVKHITKSGDGKMIIKGFANTSDKDRIGDVVLPSAFKNSLAEYMENPVILFQHNWDKVIGKCIKAEIIEEGEMKGLYIEVEISGATDVSDVKTKILEGSLKTFSIGYNELDADFNETEGVNVVKELELLEISVVTIPCNPKAKFTVEAEAQKDGSEKSFEKDQKAFFTFMAENLNELKSDEKVDGEFLEELADLFFKSQNKDTK